MYQPVQCPTLRNSELILNISLPEGTIPDDIKEVVDELRHYFLTHFGFSTETGTGMMSHSANWVSNIVCYAVMSLGIGNVLDTPGVEALRVIQLTKLDESLLSVRLQVQVKEDDYG